MTSRPHLGHDVTGLPPIREVVLPGVPIFARGKVREMYDLGDRLLMVASDRISAFDVVMQEGVPGKGLILTALSQFWFEKTARLLPNHLISADFADFPTALRAHGDLLQGRALLVRKARRVDIECVVRGYLAGSAWAEYRRSGSVAGVPMPSGLAESERLPEPIFTPAIKAASGHDENISVVRMRELVGVRLTAQLERLSLELYRFAEAHARRRGLILADTKFEFGLIGNEVLLIDEALTPDSSRYWPANAYAPGQTQPSFDKQYLRDYLEHSGWNKEPPPPALPDEVVQNTAEKYWEAYDRLVSESPSHPQANGE